MNKLWKTPISHTPSWVRPYWTQDGQGYQLDKRIGGVVKIKEPAPEGYLEQKRKERRRAAEL